MRLHDKYLSFVVNFLLGVAWAFAIIGAVTSFLSLIHDSLFLASIAFFVGAIPGFIAVLLLELVIVTKEKYFELQKQTKLLERLLEK